MKPMKRAIHIDFHNMPGIKDFGSLWDAKKIVETLKTADVEYINAFVKCNRGFAYYPTKIGIPYPSMKVDMFGELLNECHKAGIGVTAYFNAGLDHEHARLHRDWCVQNKEGQVIYGDRTLYAFRNMCYKSDYRNYLLEMTKEVLNNYDVDGMFFDCMWLNTCYGNECLEEIRNKGLDPLDDINVINHSKEVRLEICRDIKKIVGDDKYLYFNGLPERDVNQLNTHIEIECLPSGSYWGYDFFLPQVSYLRNLKKPVIYMTGRFQTDWGDFGGYKGKASLQNDIWDAISNGVGVSIGDHMHPDGQLEQQIYNDIGSIYRAVKKLEPFTDGAEYIADIGVLGVQIDTEGMLSDAYKGLARMLAELKYSFDIVTEEVDLSDYKLLIIPEAILMTPFLKSKIEKHLSENKGVLSVGEGGLNADKSEFALKQWRFQFEGTDTSNSPYFQMKKEINSDVKDMIFAMYSPGILIKDTKDTDTIAEYINPYFDRHWDGFNGYFYTPPKKDETGYAAVAKADSIFHICFNIFNAYYLNAMYSHKALVKYCLEKLLPDPMIRCKGMPSTSRVTLTRKNNYNILHVKVTYPEARGNMKIIEEQQVIPAGAIISVKGQYSSVFLACDGHPIEFDTIDDYTNLIMPTVEGYIMVVMEKESYAEEQTS